MRAKTEWWIFKDYPRDADWWDGPFKTKKRVVSEFNKHYRNDGKLQDFVMVKIAYNPMPTPRLKQ
jgi:hypothetical protein